MIRVLATAALASVAFASCDDTTTESTYVIPVLDPYDFVCLGDAAKVVTFANNPTVAVPDLPTIRNYIGAWGDQYAAGYAAYIIMREKLGFNVSMYPTTDPNNGWSATGSYTNLYDWMRDDEMDFIFEVWPTMETGVNGNQYYSSGAVDYGGHAGAYGEISWYVPRYFVEEYPTSVVLAEINQSSDLRQQLIEASLGGGDTATTNWISYYNHTEACVFDAAAFTAEGVDTFDLTALRASGFTVSEYSAASNISGLLWDVFSKDSCDFDSSNFTNCDFDFDTLNTHLVNVSVGGASSAVSDYISTTPFVPGWDIPDGTKPVIWGSVTGYQQSIYSNGLKEALGMDVHYVTTGGEGSLQTLVNELYLARKPFIANIYTPDANFAQRDPTTGELQKFEKVALWRNPDQSTSDPCYATYTNCQYPVESIKKLANPALQQNFPEAWDFYNGYYIGTSAIQTMMSYYNFVKDVANMSESEKWLNASCEWLQSDEGAATWNNSDMLIDVVRYDCLSGCGLETSVGSGVYVGGSCDYFTGLCVCEHDEIFSDTNCTESCPGLVGPTHNGTDYTFDFCSGHGDCDTTTRQCSCALGYGPAYSLGTDCGTKYYQWAFDLPVAIVIIIFSVFIAIAVIGCIVWLRANSHYKTVKALSVDMTTLMSVGLLLLAISNIVNVLPVNSGTCIAFQWSFGLGGILAILSPLLKAYRVSRVFHGGKMLRAVKITDRMLMVMLIKAALVEAVICIAYTVCHELFGGSVVVANHDEMRFEDACNDSSITGYVNFGSYVYFFFMLCALTYYSYGTRRALSVFKESTCAYFSSFLSLFCTLIVFLFWMVEPDPTFQRAVQAFAVIIVVAAVLGLFYGTRIYAFWKEPENRNVTDMGARTTTTNSYTGGPPVESTSDKEHSVPKQ